MQAKAVLFLFHRMFIERIHQGEKQGFLFLNLKSFSIESKHE